MKFMLSAGLFVLLVSPSHTSSFLPVPIDIDNFFKRRDGGWGRWWVIADSLCTQTCGSQRRVKRYRRFCDNPSPVNHGSPCYGRDSKTDVTHCPLPKCPIDGAWGTWLKYKEEACTLTCGGSTINRVFEQRECNRPAPKYKGKKCPGEKHTIKTYSCISDRKCPVDGGWGSWHVVLTSECSKTCGNGTEVVSYKRDCDDPAPKYGGSCPGNGRRFVQQVCFKQCPDAVNGGWGSWKTVDEGECSVSCYGPGTKMFGQTRKCDDPLPMYGGKQCLGDSSRFTTVDCFSENKCPGVPFWTSWHVAVVGSCSLTCGSGTLMVTFSRQCKNIDESNAHVTCPGHDVKAVAEICSFPCPKHNTGAKGLSLESILSIVGIGMILVILMNIMIVYSRRLKQRALIRKIERLNAQAIGQYNPGIASSSENV